jgi:hypothetical protein
MIHRRLPHDAGRPGDPSLRRAVVVFFNFASDVFLDGRDSGIAIPTILPASNATTILQADMDDDDSARAALARAPTQKTSPTQSAGFTCETANPCPQHLQPLKFSRSPGSRQRAFASLPLPDSVIHVSRMSLPPKQMLVV